MKNAHVLYTFDNDYAPICGVSLTSLLVNSRDLDMITIYLAALNLDDDNKNKFERLGKEFGREIIFIDALPYANRLRDLGFKPFRRFSNSADVYAPLLDLLIEDYISQDVDKVIYLDCDTLIVNSIGRFLDVDMGDNCIAMSHDIMNEFKLSHEYYNMGSTIFDMKNWRDGHWLEKIIEYNGMTSRRYFSAAEYLLNKVCAGHIFELPIKFNYLIVHRVISDDILFRVLRCDEDTKKDVLDARCDPVMLHTHLIFGAHPWNPGAMHPDEQLFMSYLQLSPWHDAYSPRPIEPSKLVSIEKLMYKYMPRSLFFVIFCALQKSLHFINARQLKQRDKADKV